MAKRLRGETQTNTRGNTAFTGAGLALATDVRDGTQTPGLGGMQLEFYKHLQGQIMTGDPGLTLARINSEPQFLQNKDLTQLYKDRSFQLLDDQISSEIYNDRNVFLITVAVPLFVTNEMSFHNQRKEWNQIDWTRVSETGLGEQTTFSSWTWTDKMERRRMEAEMTLESVMDVNFGASVWDENIGVLVSTGLLTLMKEAAYGTYTLGYANEIEDKISNIPMDLSKLFRWEANSFHCAAKSIDEFLFQCQQAMLKLPGQSNIVIIMPLGTSMRMRHVAGETKPSQGMTIILNPQTLEYERRVFEGPAPVMTIRLGSTTAQVYEMPGFKVRTRDETVEDPSICRITQCQVFPCDPNNKLTDPVEKCDRQANDMWVFYQDLETGEYRRVAWADMLRYSWTYDPVDGTPSVYLQALADQKNDETERALKWPVQFDWQNNARGDVARDINDESPLRDYDHPDAMEIGQETDLEQMTSWRHHCAMLTFDPRQGKWRIPRLMGDFQLSNMPNAAFLKAARQLVTAHDTAAAAPPLGHVLAELKQILAEINATPFSDAYVQALIDANAPFLQPVDAATRWPVNRHGALRLPSGAGGALDGTYWPAGFGFGGGLNTIEEEGNVPNSPYREGALRISAWKKNGGARLISFIEEALGANTAVLNGDLADDVHDGQATALDTIIATLYGRPRYVLMGVPSSAAAIQADAPRTTPLQQVVEYVRATDAAAINLADYTVPANTVFRALFSLNAAAINAVKNRFMDYFSSDVSAEAQDLIMRLSESILQLVPYEADAATLVNVGAVSMMAREIIAAAGADFATAKAALTNLAKFSNKKYLTERKADWKNDAGYTDNTAPLRAALKQAETNTVPLARAAQGAVDVRAQTPSVWLPAALVATDALDRYVQTSGNYWIVPQGPAQKPVKTRRDFKARDDEYARFKKSLKGLHGLAGIYSLGSVKNGASNAMDVEGVAPQRTQKSMRLDANRVGTGNISRQRGRAPVEVAAAPDTIEDAYFGPWRNRLEFASTIADPAVQLMFLALIQADNVLDTHLRIGDVAGAKLINVILFRPFVESTAKSTVVMQGAGEAALTAMSRVRALVSKEDRGVVHVGASMYTACVRRNPQAVRLVPCSHPNTFIGGKQINFVTHPKQLFAPSELRPSFIALPTAIVETVYKYPVDMLNQPTYIRPGIDTDIYYRKYSAAELYRVVFGARQVESVRSTHSARLRYWDYVEVCHVGYLGPRRFKDAATGLIRAYRGNGAGNDENMNQEGAEKVWNGAPMNYPAEVALVNQQMRV